MPVAGAVIGAVGSIAGGAMGARGQRDAAQAETQGQRDAIQAQLAMFNQSRADQLPMINARNQALPLFMQLLGINMPAATTAQAGTGGVQMNVTGARRNDRGWTEHFQDQLGIPGVGRISSNPIKAFGDTLRTPFRNFADWDGSAMADDPGSLSFTYDEAGNVVGSQPSATTVPAPSAQFDPGALQRLIAATPGYQFRLGEGIKATERSAAARGGLNSGATLRALQRYGEGLAASEFGDFANRLASIIGIGQSAATTAGGWGNQVGGNIGQNLANIGQARGSSYANQANIWGNAIGGAANSLGQYMQNRPGGTIGGSTPYNQGAWQSYGYGG